ncbi:alkylation response protein AidB-like acyl-CoA dehydrogenase [Stella humosa]|uniref:3-methylmercaptopropionyl-CoA dehydrogenase n=1 Tax=Stella humosa TaxID=94 RepID=A0A3N1KY18_9PROT|nr:acyl-CoA dehydrogenase [Stella humosa]ROP83198.1 alkylation response protein AidB-like acyl-CoA dehydrogenase [Stella humosa]BBK30023.1 acyl-CoA dehydrogenase [Stella humosa]
MNYTAPVADMRFVLRHIAGLDQVALLPGAEGAEPDLVDQILDEAARFAGGVLAPLNRSGDQEGSRLENGVVRTPKGFRDAYQTFVEAGWNSLPFDPEHGGQGLPWLVGTAVGEMWASANMAFSLCPLLTQGAIELLSHHASPEQKAAYLPDMIAGTWTGTMNLTEPHAGSDLGLIRSRAVPQADGTYRIAGQKIFITWGDHDLAQNIIHMVLARTPDAPAGSRGISLFIVPRYLLDADGRPGPANDVRTVSLEHKLGIHASPTCVLSFGDADGGAVGFRVGEENRGLEYMFTMMNNARLSVGLEGVAIAERAYQQARDYALARVQSREIGASDPTPVAIARHPDVRRMLLSMRARTEASRALAYTVAAALDHGLRHPDPAERARQQAFVDLMIPVVKAWSTDLGVEVASTGVQVHGGVGFVEETGAAQHLRDARIAPIYEGTNGIQANDLLFRKLGRDGGAAAGTLINRMRADLDSSTQDDIAAPVRAGIDTLETATAWMVAHHRSEPRLAAAGAVPYLQILGTVAGGWLMAKAAGAAATALAAGEDPAFHQAKIATARFYATHEMPTAAARLATLTTGGAAVTDFAVDWL